MRRRLRRRGRWWKHWGRLCRRSWDYMTSKKLSIKISMIFGWLLTSMRKYLRKPSLSTKARWSPSWTTSSCRLTFKTFPPSLPWCVNSPQNMCKSGWMGLASVRITATLRTQSAICQLCNEKCSRKMLSKRLKRCRQISWTKGCTSIRRVTGDRVSRGITCWVGLDRRVRWGMGGLYWIGRLSRLLIWVKMHTILIAKRRIVENKILFGSISRDELMTNNTTTAFSVTKSTRISTIWVSWTIQSKIMEERLRF